MQWEYKTIMFDKVTFMGRYNLKKLSEKLNEQGENGWELVNCNSLALLLGRPLTLIFKKPKDHSQLQME